MNGDSFTKTSFKISRCFFFFFFGGGGYFLRVYLMGRYLISFQEDLTTKKQSFICRDVCFH